eukprot:51205-Chlamydomonas_euryale.AAC.3
MPTSLSAGGANEKAAALFRDYDTNQRNYLDHEQLMAALAEFGTLNGLPAKKLGGLRQLGRPAGRVGRRPQKTGKRRLLHSLRACRKTRPLRHK